MDLTRTLMELNTLADGSKIFSKVKVKRRGQMELSLKVNTWRARNMATVPSAGLTVAYIKASLTLIVLKDMATMLGLTVESTKASGKTTSCTVTGSSRGPMAGLMRASTPRTRSTARVSSSGPMVEPMKGAGCIASSTVSAITNLKMEQRRKVDGRMVNDKSGLIKPDWVNRS